MTKTTSGKKSYTVVFKNNNPLSICADNYTDGGGYFAFYNHVESGRSTVALVTNQEVLAILVK